MLYHRFLCPQKALGRPVIIRIAPSTPKAGSSFVSRTVLGRADAEDEAEDVAEAEDAVGV